MLAWECMGVNDTIQKKYRCLCFTLFLFFFCSKTIYKPVSVYAVIHLELILLLISSNLPRRILGHFVSIWFCSRWGLPCHSCYQKCGELLPRLFTLTTFGGIFSVVLSLELPLPGVTRHRCPWRPDFPLLKKSNCSIVFTYNLKKYI